MLLLGAATDSTARYWVGGDGVWTATSTANWSYYSGGPGGAPAPTQDNNVYFDANSDIGVDFTVILDRVGANTNVTCKSLYVYPDKVISFKFPGSSASIYSWCDINIYDSLYITSTTSLVDLSAFENGWIDIYFISVSGQVSYIDTNNLLLNTGYIEFAGAGTYNLLSPLNLGIEETYSYFVLRDTVTFNTNNYNMRYCNSYHTATTTLNLGTSSIYTSGDSFELPNSSPNATIYFNNYGMVSNGYINGGWTVGTIYLETTFPENTSYFYFNTNVTVTNLYIRAPSYGGYTLVGLQNTSIITNLIFLDTAPNKRIYLYGEDYPSGITVTTIAGASDIDIEGITITGAAAPLSGVRIRDRGTNTGITPSTFTPKTVYWNKPNGGTIFDTAYATTSGGAVSDSNFPFDEDTIIIDDVGLLANKSIIIPENICGTGFSVSTIDASSRSQPFTISELYPLTNVNATLNLYLNEFKFPVSSSVNINTSIIDLGQIDNDTGRARLGIYLGTFTTSSNINITGNYTGYPNIVFGGSLNNYKLYTNIYGSYIGIILPATFDANGYNITSSFWCDIGSQTIVTLGTGTWQFSASTGRRTPITGIENLIDKSPDLETANFIWKPKGSGTLQRRYDTFGEYTGTYIQGRTPRRVNSLKIEPQHTVGVILSIESILPRSIEFTSITNLPFTVRFGHLNTDQIYDIDSFIVTNTSGVVTLSGAPTNFRYTQRGSIVLNNVITDGVRVYPTNNWYATNSTGSDQGWTYSAPPVLTTVDGDNIVTANQSAVTIVGTNLSTADGVQLRQGNNILNTTNYVAGSSPTFTLPNISSIFSSGIKFGTVQLDIMENI